MKHVDIYKALIEEYRLSKRAEEIVKANPMARLEPLKATMRASRPQADGTVIKRAYLPNR